jgi:hypothetical protein
MRAVAGFAEYNLGRPASVDDILRSQRPDKRAIVTQDRRPIRIALPYRSPSLAMQVG